MTQHIDNYDGMTVDEVKEEVRSGSFSHNELKEILSYEEENKDRVTITRWLEDRVEENAEVEPDEVTVEMGNTTGYVAGLLFERPFERKTVEFGTRIKRALERGDLRRVD